MKLEQALMTLRKAEPDLRAKGIRHAGIFGSTARDEARPDSDIDILVDFDPSAAITIYDYVAIATRTCHGERYRMPAMYRHDYDVVFAESCGKPSRLDWRRCGRRFNPN